MPKRPIPQPLQLEFDRTASEHFEIAAAVWAAFVFPESRKESKRALLQVRLAAEFVRECYPQNSPAALQPQPVRPVYWYVTNAQLKHGLTVLEQRIRIRFDAGLMALTLIDAAKAGRPTTKNDGSPLSVAEAAREVRTFRGAFELNSFLQRRWRPSISVLHLAAGYVNLCHRARSQGLSDPGPIQFLRDPQLFFDWLHRASEAQRLLGESLLRIRPSELLQLRIFDGKTVFSF